MDFSIKQLSHLTIILNIKQVTGAAGFLNSQLGKMSQTCPSNYHQAAHCGTVGGTHVATFLR